MRDQADRGNQFYLYRVHLKPSVVEREGWIIDPEQLPRRRRPRRGLPSRSRRRPPPQLPRGSRGLSLALGREAIDGVQRVAVPLLDSWDVDWVGEAAADLEGASDALGPEPGKLGRFRPPSSPRAALARELGAALAGRLPINLRDQFESAVSFGEGDDPVLWARRTIRLFGLIEDPARVLAALDRVERRRV